MRDKPIEISQRSPGSLRVEFFFSQEKSNEQDLRTTINNFLTNEPNSERPNFTDGLRPINHDRSTPLESYSQQHWGKTDQSVFYEPDLERSTDNNCSIDSDDDFGQGCRNVSHHYRQQCLSGLHTSGRSNYTITRYSRVQTIYCNNFRKNSQARQSRVQKSVQSNWRFLHQLNSPSPKRFDANNENLLGNHLAFKYFADVSLT